MKVLYVFACAASMSISTFAFAASNGEVLFNEHNCSMCHSADTASLGPSLKDISAKYANSQGATGQLEAKVRNGGKGSFGSMPMPATPKSVSDENIKTMVHWILTR